ncbi:MAG: tetratricopeptide repeat protein, partial [Saprospiraceae bacterium]|nr:tetratricopeptide repeat protein [Saprospiraceae bacterium]
MQNLSTMNIRNCKKVRISRLFPFFLVYFLGNINAQSTAAPCNLSDTIIAFDLLKGINKLVEESNFDQALTDVDKAYAIYSCLFGEQSLQVAETFNSRSMIYYFSGKYENAVDAVLKTLEIRKKQLGKLHPKIADSYNNLANNYDAMGNSAKAIEHYQNALDVRIGVFGFYHPDVAQSYSNLGLSLLWVNEYQKALEYTKKGLEIRQKILNPDHPDIAVSMLNMAEVLTEFTEYDQALNYAKKACDIYLKRYGLQHPNVPSFLSTLAKCYSNKSDYNQSIHYHHTALLLKKKLYGDWHFTMPENLVGLGIGYNIKGDFEKSKEYFSEALLISKKYFGDLHENTAIIINNMSASAIKNNEYDAALQYLNEGLEVSNKLGIEALVALYTSNMGGLYLELKDYSKARVLLDSALNKRIRLFGNENPDVAETLSLLGHYFSRTGDYEQGIEYQTKAISSGIKALGEHHALISNYYATIGENYGKIKAYTLQDSFYRISLNVLNVQSFDSLEKHPNLEEIPKVLSTYANAKYYQYKTTLDKNALYFSTRLYQATLQLLDIQNRKISPASKYALTNQARDAYFGKTTNFIELYHLTDSLHYLHEAFSFAERSKAFLLYEALQESKALQFAGIPDSLLQQEYDLRID